MVECQHCGAYLEEDPDEVGARCPRCREPLFDRGGAPKSAWENSYDDDRGACAVHPQNVAAGLCQRCGNFVCRVCRTRWEDRGLCVACVERLIAEKETAPEEAQAHRRQAVLSLTFGLGAWGALAGGLFLGVAVMTQSGDPGLGLLLVAGSIFLAPFGVGQGAVAIRTRGDRMLIATWGLILSALHLGVVSGLVLVALWRLKVPT
jgi:hypothetical protein